MNDMTKGNPLSLILRFAIPLLLGNLLQQLYNVADASIVGRFLGADALAAVGATSSVQFLILGFCIGSCTGFCIPIAQKFGAKDYGALRRLIFNSAVLVLLGSVIITTVCVLLCPKILTVLSAPENIWEDTRIYILIIFLGIPFTLLYNLAAGILRAIGNSRTPFFFLAFSTVINIFLDLFCIVILKWGCMGAAVATVASQALSGVLCTWVILKKYNILRIRRNECQMEGAMVRTLLFMGLPMGLQFSITAIGSMVMQSSINGLGSAYASAFTATSRVKVFAMCPMDAIASGVATFCSQNYGAGDSGRISAGFRIGNIAGALYGALAGVLLFFFGRSACLIFLSASETQILDSCAMFLRYNSYFFWLLGLLNVTRITVQGLGFSGRAIFSGVMEMIARISISLLLVPRIGFEAVCLSDPAAWIAADLYILPTGLYVMHKVRILLKQQKEEKEKHCTNLVGRLA